MRRLYVSGLVYAAGLVLVNLAFQSNREFLRVFSGVIFPVTSGIATIASFLLLRKYGFNWKDKFERIWINVFIGIFLLFLGDTVWTIFGLRLGLPRPFLVDALFLGVYASFLMALIGILSIFRLSVSYKEIGLTITATVIVAITNFFFLSTSITAYTGEPIALVAITPYLYLDLSLFAACFLALLTFLKGKIGKAWLFLTVGILMNTTADLLFGNLEFQGLFYEGHPVELLWLLSYVTFIFGIHVYRREF